MPTRQHSLTWWRSLSLLFCAMALLPMLAVLCMPSFTSAVTEEEFVGPFPSWANVKTVFGAVGNGVADDTLPIQACLDALAAATQTVCYFPAGTYKLTALLYIESVEHVALVGEHPSTTILKWAGASNASMYYPNGIRNMVVSRLTFDGSTIAKTAVYQGWDGTTVGFDTRNAYIDMVFKDVGYGIDGGEECCGFAETTVLRSTFLRNSIAGVATRNFNALDLWVWYSTFDSCAKGVSNNPGHGNFRVYNSYFTNSTIADIYIGDTGNFSLRFNTSLNSQRFLEALGTGNPAEMSIHGNTILDTVSNLAINIGNQGPIFLLDNTVRSRTGATAPIMFHNISPTCDLISIGNTFTVASPVSTACRLIESGTSVVPRANLTGLGAPDLPTTPTSQGRTVFEVAANASGATIQAAINSAVSSGTTRPVVHVPPGTSSIPASLTIPANSDVQLVGDGGRTVFQASGSTPVLAIAGPSKATLRDFRIEGNGQKGITLQGVDQSGARLRLQRVTLDLSTTNNLFVDGLDRLMIDARDFVNDRVTTNVAVLVKGGPLADAGTPAEGRTLIFSAGTSNNKTSYFVSNGGSLLVRDAWYETGSSGSSQFLDLTNSKGTLTIDNAHVALPQQQANPAIRISGHNGKVSLLSNDQEDRISIEGDGSLATVLAMGMLGHNNGGLTPDYFTNGAGANARLLNSRQMVDGAGSVQFPNEGVVDQTVINTMIAQTRFEPHTLLTTLAPGVSDVRMFNLTVNSSSIGLHVMPGAGAAPGATAPQLTGGRRF